MKLRKLLILSGLLIACTVYSQNRISLNRIYSTEGKDVNFPFMTDTTNLKGENFKAKELLQTYISFPEKHELTEELLADAKDYFYFRKPRETDARFYMVSFNLLSDNYSKPTIRITSPGMFELYIDGKKELTKTTVEDSLHRAKMLEKQFTVLPGTTNFVLKYMSLASNDGVEGVKISVEPQAGDVVTNLQLRNDGKRFIGIRDVVEGNRIVDTKISPSGRFVIINYREVTNEGKTNNYTELVDTRTNRKTPLSSQSIAWMPRSDKYYYTVSRENKLQLLGVHLETFVEEVLAENIPAGSFWITPDEKSLLFSDKENYDDRKGDLKLLASPEDRQSGYYDRYFLYKYDLQTGVKQRLTFGRQTTQLHDISSDSRYILFSVKEEDMTERPFSKTSYYRMDINTMQVETLYSDEPFLNGAQFSPDGKKILFTGAPDAFSGIGLHVEEGEIANLYDTQAFVMDISTKSVEAITKDFNPAIQEAYWNEVDNNIYFLVADGEYVKVYSYNPSRNLFHALSLSEEVIKNFSLASKAGYAVYSGSSVSNSFKAYVLDLKNEISKLISDPYKNTLEELILGDVREWNFTASDGTIIEGRYYLPPHFDADKKYPMIVYYYGGTTPVNRAYDYPYPMHVYAEQGYVVYVLQPSGTIGYGQEFSARHVNAWGKRTADDIIEGTTQFADIHPFVDKTKIGCLGASYGGFMTMYLQTVTDIFAAAVSHAGISSISSYWGEGYWGYTYSSAATANSYPWNNREIYVDQSPLFNADKIHTPLLLLHGTDDTNVPVGESIQMYTALKILGRPVEFIQVKGENHGIGNYKRKLEWNYSIFAWFAKWLKEDDTWWNALYPEK